MKDSEKTKEQLINELSEFRQQVTGYVTELQKSEIKHQQTEKTLGENEEKYRILVELATDGILVETVEGRILESNIVGAKMFGYTKEEMIGLTLADLVPEEFSKKLPKIITDKETTYGIFVPRISKKKDGTIFPTEIASKIVNVAGKPRLISYIRDISKRKEAEKKLRKARKMFSSLFNSSPEALVYYDKEGRILNINLRFTELFGYTSKEMIGRNIDEGMITSTDKIKEGKILTQKAFKGFSGYETIRKKKDGTLVPVIISSAPVIIDKKAQGTIALYKDITERKRAEESLRKSQQEFSSLFRNSPEALAYLDKKGNILDINSRFIELFGYTLQEVRGRNIDDGMIHPPDKIEEGKRLTKRSLEGYLNYETIRKKKDGTLFPASLSGSWVMLDGQLKGMIALYQDITEGQRMLKTIKKSEERFRDLFENASDAIWTADAKGRYISVNCQFRDRLGFKKEELIGKKSIYLVAPESRGKSIENYKKTLTGEPTEHETVVLNKKGEKRIHRERLRPLKEEGKIIGVQGIGRDITERKQNETMQKVLYNISQAANSPISLNQLYPLIHQELGTVIDATNFYIALVNEKEEKINFPYYIDEKDNNFPVFKLSSNNTLTTHVIRSGQPLFINRKQLNGMVNQGVLTPWGTVSDKSVWLGVPLKVEDKVIGAMVVQSYTNPELYSEEDIKIMEFVSSQVATAIERKRTEERIKHLSFHDVLTGLYNRAYFEEELKRLNTPRYYPLSMISIDVNGLKVINDTFGHDQGDKLLQHLASLLTSISRKGDIIARVGGDEFAIILPSTNTEQGHDFCERVRKVCLKDDIEPAYLRVNLALGYVTQEGEYKDMNTLLKEADQKMYQDKLFSAKSREKYFLEAFRIILAERDPHTSDHSQRLQELALALGKRVGLTGYQSNNLRLLALLHDIGKIGIPDGILFKTCILTPSEWEKMREHSRIGYRMAKNIPNFAPIAQEILHHHEHWDGTGYPDGLKGKEIPLLSRIISIIDAYDVMQSRRPYKRPVSKTEALKEIKRCAVTQFDPQLVKIFLKIVT